MHTVWLDRRHILFDSVSPWSLSCQRSCTPSLRTSWTGMSPRRSARRKRRRRGTASTRRSLTKRWRPQRSHCSLLKLSYCQRRYWSSMFYSLFPLLPPPVNLHPSFPFLFYCNRCTPGQSSVLLFFTFLLCTLSCTSSLKIFCGCLCFHKMLNGRHCSAFQAWCSPSGVILKIRLLCVITDALRGGEKKSTVSCWFLDIQVFLN